ncbi:activator of Hsp90 ATPase [Syncephalis pseudoplumigaleata]|uniref:Activator of Hsp90 ATPase n=1 Tax=Syncephalis pseudoplumigaleata TaxID=1712513 RepID=A0A4V1J1Z3_9FUNG|nr:activator of Hsp90 ATPase [Syncephalis pseudoplumigaleata]|eukprot:RKP26759.1 activator of Hsp90 ATPase [Syncephalis pseudoplumigaleata]
MRNRTEKNCSAWTKTYFSEQLPGTSVSDASGATAKVTSVLDCTGDVDINQRKGKVITLYDLVLKLGVEGQTASGTSVKGSINIPEIMHDTSEDEFVFDLTIESETREMDAVKQLIRTSLTAELRKKLGRFAKDLIDAHSKDVYIPPEELGLSPSTQTSTASKAGKAASASSGTADTVSSKPVATHFSTTDIKFSVEFVAAASDIYDVLLNQEKVQAWTRGPAVIRPEVGSDFRLFDGNITGTIVELVPNETIVLSWRFASWPANHHSNVAITLAQGDSSTELRLTQRGVPVGQEDTTRQNWQRFYWDSINRTFGYGTSM